jgi:hypothetical protein
MNEIGRSGGCTDYQNSDLDTCNFDEIRTDTARRHNQAYLLKRALGCSWLNKMTHRTRLPRQWLFETDEVSIGSSSRDDFRFVSSSNHRIHLSWMSGNTTQSYCEDRCEPLRGGHFQFSEQRRDPRETLPLSIWHKGFIFKDGRVSSAFYKEKNSRGFVFICQSINLIWMKWIKLCFIKLA